MKHQVFERFTRFEGPVSEEYAVDFLGVLTRKSFHPIREGEKNSGTSGKSIQRTEYPPFEEEWFEWVDLLEAVAEAQGSFTFVELGAGYGRWTVKAAAAIRKLHGDLPFHLIAVEAEPTHFEWLLQHLSDNGINPKDHLLLPTVVSDLVEEVFFTIGNPAAWYGQAVVPSAAHCPENEVVKINAVTLPSLLETISVADLIDLDIQGLEGKVVKASIDTLNAKAKRLHIGTHSKENEISLRETLLEHGWVNIYDFSTQSTPRTEWGPVSFLDGVQSWINPRFHPSACSRLDLSKLHNLSVAQRSQIAQHELQVSLWQTKLADMEKELEYWKSQGLRIQKYISELERFINPGARRKKVAGAPARSEDEILKEMLERTNRSKLIRLHRFLEKRRKSKS